MKLRGANRFALGYYRLIGSVHLGEPVEAGDAELSDNHEKRDRLLTRYAGGTACTDVDQAKGTLTYDTPQREDSPAQSLELQGRRGERAAGPGDGAGPDGEPRG